MYLVLHSCQLVDYRLEKANHSLLALGVSFDDSLDAVCLLEIALDDDLAVAVQQYLCDLIRREEAELLVISLLTEGLGGLCHLLAAPAECVED